ncbi:hypothetical protein CDD81_5463 [Ophiocordyceps australis]|uniref:Uncharacterized protein n=1 Tax=Ophiocordyceps australis TaxID=1399860 RepID=A0A2C5Y7Y1_9HYPO|nr:hypothetical protein CDD81_5463 [Ophiocordyceps australis]
MALSRLSTLSALSLPSLSALSLPSRDALFSLHALDPSALSMPLLRDAGNKKPLLPTTTAQGPRAIRPCHAATAPHSTVAKANIVQLDKGRSDSIRQAHLALALCASASQHPTLPVQDCPGPRRSMASPMAASTRA